MLENIQPDFDFGLLYDMTDGDAEMVASLLEVIQRNLEEAPEKFTQLAQENDWRAVGKFAHKLKSSIAYLGYDAFADLLSQLEIQASEGATADMCAPMLKQVYIYTAATCEVIRKERQSLEE